jgi:hypothetical protein
MGPQGATEPPSQPKEDKEGVSAEFIPLTFASPAILPRSSIRLQSGTVQTRNFAR